MNFFVITHTNYFDVLSLSGKIAQERKTAQEHKVEKWKSTKKTAVMSFIFPVNFCICFHIKKRELDGTLLWCPIWSHSMSSATNCPFLLVCLIIHTAFVKPWMEEQCCNQSSPTITSFLFYCYYFLFPLNHL